MYVPCTASSTSTLTLASDPSSSHSMTRTGMVGGRSGIDGIDHAKPVIGITLGCCKHLHRHTSCKTCKCMCSSAHTLG